MLNMNIKRIAAISICSVLVTSGIPVYAESIGSININASINSKGFEGEIYVILADSTGKQKLALLTPSNNYKYKLDNLQYGKYQIKDIHVFDNTNESDKNRQSMIADYSLDYESLNVSEKNQNPNVTVDIHSLQTQKKSEANTSNDTNKSDTNIKNEDSNEKNDTNNNTQSTKETDDNKDIKATDKNSNNYQDPSVERRKNFIFWSFIIDVILIASFGSIWFFKIRNKDKKEDK